MEEKEVAVIPEPVTVVSTPVSTPAPVVRASTPDIYEDIESNGYLIFPVHLKLFSTVNLKRNFWIDLFQELIYFKAEYH